MRPIPRLLETYEEARLLLEAKGWGLAKASDHLSELPGLAGFNLSQASLSRKTNPGNNHLIEPEVSAAIEGMETQGRYGRQTEIVTAGLRAVHGDPPIVDVRQLAKDLRECLPASELALKLVEALEEKAGQGPLLENVASSIVDRIADRLRATRLFQKLVERLGHASWKQIAISAGSGALVACLVLLVAPLLPGRAAAAARPGPLVIIIPGAGPDGSPVRFEPESLSAMSEWGENVPEDQPVPVKLLPGQKAPPCDSRWRQEAINAGCWIELAAKPPCGPYFRRGDKCYAPVAADPKKPLRPAP